MKIYDISQEVFSCAVYPGDKAPRIIEEMRTSRGDLYNLTSFEMGAHNGTHIDAPFHFLPEGDTVERIPLEKTVGFCYVSQQDGEIGGAQAEQMLHTAALVHPDCARRLLIRGQGVVTEEAAHVFAARGVQLVGVEGQTAGPEDAPMAVHLALLGAKAVILEGLRLREVPEGVYFLCAAPLSLGGSDGAPCRAILLDPSGLR